ncbi:hypothetical protein P43SY_002274 [Pythium insidiosum]|uniref:Uncharacterized protein n=1 Tax=Pythium insidiosum TaxID=114742 RepID=A0AAD5M1Y2_PYTIN|nr:hypothetical protein P43SY_002274 [Pythium insidiosum]
MNELTRLESGGSLVLRAIRVDALTPAIRRAVSFHIRHAAVVGTLSFASSAIAVNLLIFDESSNEIRDRVLWSGNLFGHHAEIRLLPTFYNCFATLLGWSLRLLHRLWTVDNDVLVVLDGPVVYDNYLAQARQRVLIGVILKVQGEYIHHAKKTKKTANSCFEAAGLYAFFCVVCFFMYQRGKPKSSGDKLTPANNSVPRELSYYRMEDSEAELPLVQHMSPAVLAAASPASSYK